MLSKYSGAYLRGIQMDQNTIPKPLPSEVKVQPGRPKKKRNKANDIADPSETKLKRQNIKIKCTYCTKIGHNIRTCPAKVSLMLSIIVGDFIVTI